MLAKMTVKNQITLPKAVADRFPGVEYFEICFDQDSIRLEPFRRSRIGEVWAHLEALGITEEDVDDAVAWARKNPQP
jgi:hypothetical protein